MAVSERAARPVLRAGAGAVERRPRFDFLPYLLVLPAVLVVLLLTVYPAVYAVWLSLTDANLLRLASAHTVGLANYEKAAGDDVLIGSIGNTIRWVVAAAGLQMLLALPVALFLNQAFFGRGAIRAGILIPWVVPSVVVATVWRFMVDANYGVLNDVMVRLHVIGSYVAWMSEPVSSFVVVVAAQVWSGVPFFAITLLAALQAVPGELYEAARIDGATAWQRFRYVTLPLLLPTIWLLLLLRTIWLAHSVDLIFLMTQGGPGYSNYTVAVYSFLLLWDQLELAYPAALSLMLSVVLILASVVYIRLIERARGYA